MDADYAEAKRRRTIIEANILGLELREREAQLVEAAAVERERRREAERVINALLSLPDRLAPDIAAANNAFIVHQMLTAAFRKTLRRLSSEG
jgi:hypothetical protein